jgi:alpha-amylase/alpha-mannosidase (GH57 family)
MALAYCIYYIEKNELAKITNYGQYLEMYPPQWETKIAERTAWSCSHGVERWNSDCGCNTGGHGDWNQEWRFPLRQALDWLRDELVVLYENEAKLFTKDPWLLRDEYIEVILDRNPGNVDAFFARHIDRDLNMEEKKRLIKLLEMQRHAMLMYTSCGWFFDELSGLETTQVMQYAARATQLAFEISGVDYETQFQKLLEKAPTNIPEFVNGSVIYDKFIKPTRLDLLRVGVHYAIASLFSEFPDEARIYGYSAKSEYFEKLSLGKMSLAVGKVLIKSEVTWDDEMVAFAVIHLGGHIINGGVRQFQNDESFASTLNQIKESFSKADVPQVIRLIDEEFGHQNYNLFHLFKDEQRRVFSLILETTFEEIEHHFRTIFESDYSLIQAMKEMNIRIPKALSTPAEFVMNNDIRKMLEGGNIDEERLEQLVNEYIKFVINADEALAYVASNKIIGLIKNLSKDMGDINLITRIQRLVGLISNLHLNLDLWEAQNIFFIIGRKNYDEMAGMAEKGNEYARQWLEQFNRLSEYLNVSLS